MDGYIRALYKNRHRYRISNGESRHRNDNSILFTMTFFPQYIFKRMNGVIEFLGNPGSTPQSVFDTCTLNVRIALSYWDSFHLLAEKGREGFAFFDSPSRDS